MELKEEGYTKEKFLKSFSVLGLITPYYITIAGTRTYPGEILLFIIVLFSLAKSSIYPDKGDRNSFIKFRLLIALGLWNLGTLVGGIYNHSEYKYMVLEIANSTFFLTDLIFLISNVRKKTFKYFVISYCLGSIIYAFTPEGTTTNQGSIWKFGIGLPIILLILFYSLSNMKKWILIILTSGIAFLSVQNSFRSLAFVAVESLVAMVGLLSARQLKKKRNVNLVTLIFCIFIGFVLLESYSYFASQGLLGYQQELKYVNQSSTPGGVLIGARTNVLITLQSVFSSPVLGHGAYSGINSIGLENNSLARFSEQFNLINVAYLRPHTAIFGAWYQSGILGLLAWVIILLVVLQAWIHNENPTFFSIPILMLALQGIFLSPLAASNRLFLSVCIALLILPKYASDEISLKSSRGTST